MKKLLVIFTLMLSFISFSYLITNDSLYSLIIKTDYNIVNNESYLKKENVKDNYSSNLKYLDTDVINSKDEIYSMMYTILNNDYENYTFFCKYNCMMDVEQVDSLTLSLINQLVSVRNQYKEIKTTYYTDGKVIINKSKRYTKEDLDKIDTEIERLIKDLKINSYSSITDKIKVFHDYLANTNTYDDVMAKTNKSEYHSNTAIGPLFEGKAICDGYSDAMAFFLDKIGIENIKVTNDEHVWNAVKIDNTWYHIDLTWDDPVYTDGSSLTTYDYFMLTTKELENKNDDAHYFDKTYYDFIK